MSKNHLKLFIWLILVGIMGLMAYLTLTGLAELVTYFNTGADPRSALNLIPAVPPDIDQRLEWLPDQYHGHELEPFERDKISGAYLHAWGQWAISYEVGKPYGLSTYFAGATLETMSHNIEQAKEADWQIQQSDLYHQLELTFYADDGNTVAFTDRAVDLVQQIQHGDEESAQIINSVADYEVVMMLEQGRWRVRRWIRQPATPPQKESSPLSDMAARQLVTQQGVELRLDGQPYQIVGANYYPSQMPWLLFWEHYRTEQILFDLRLMRGLGLNTVRIFVPFEQFGGAELVSLHVAHLRDFLQKADELDIKVIVTLFDLYTDYQIASWATNRRHVVDLVSALADEPAILAWDIKNEPDRDYASNSPELVQAWLRYISQQIRTHDPYHLITIGWSTPQAASALVETVDFVSYHYYDRAEDYSAVLSELQRAASDKPLLLQEFGLPTWNSIWPNGHTEAEQAAYYADLLTTHAEFETAGYMVWTLYDFETVPWSLFKLPWERGPQTFMGVIRTDGKFKPAAYLLSPHANLSVVPPLAWGHRFTKLFWLNLGFWIAIMLVGLLWRGGRWLVRNNV
ncbi:cellulase family glycosylhydrolase [Anaerolineales bacterium HSG6]|nr:cellulase family glycosylhydrolase [Anaerolineales bacterium HSG6]